MASHPSVKTYLDNQYLLEDENKEEKELFLEKINPVQTDIENLFIETLNVLKKTTVTAEDYKKKVLKFVTNMFMFPNKEELEFYKSLYYYDNLGRIGIENFAYPFRWETKFQTTFNI